MDAGTMNSMVHVETQRIFFDQQIFSLRQCDIFDNQFPANCGTSEEVLIPEKYGMLDEKRKDVACQTTSIMSGQRSKNETAHRVKRPPADQSIGKPNQRRIRASNRERRRLLILNDAFRRLKQVVPTADEKTKKLDVLRMASQYILNLTLMLEDITVENQ